MIKYIELNNIEYITSIISIFNEYNNNLILLTKEFDI